MNYTFVDSNPKYAGGYRIGGPNGLQINLKKKPIWLHRTMMRLCLGWDWVDIKYEACAKVCDAADDSMNDPYKNALACELAEKIRARGQA